MLKCVLSLAFIFNLILINAFHKEHCAPCVSSRICRQFVNMNRREQQNWRRQYVCTQPIESLGPINGGDYVCCPGLSVTTNVNEQQGRTNNYRIKPEHQPQYTDQNFYRNKFTNNERKNIRRLNNNKNFGKSPNVTSNLRPIVQNQYPPSSNPNLKYFLPKVTSSPKPQNVFTTPMVYNRTMNNQILSSKNINRNIDSQCLTTILPPVPTSGCCGVDTFGTVGMPDIRTFVSQRVSDLSNNNNRRINRQTENDNVTVDLDNRIAGGSETELNQFPWTVRLKTTYDFGNNITAFECGGSIISSRYVLTAGHCVSEDGATLRDLVVYMAEYDKRTFPRDCKVSTNGMSSCVNNAAVKAEKIIRHSAFDSRTLNNDIALIRLQEFVPFTEFIRPICLPSININNEALFGLPLPVAGWGRNGPYVSNVKQSTVLNLVDRNTCLQYYPYLQPSHICAVGKTGEDTCKGDSGGPLMALSGGVYYIVGIVSGKRSDVPCGTAVPTLYTNVFQNLQWIRAQME
ncbi:CLIP domain-containing serine protease B8-like isoform X2 [Battus philenor]|uniref:CLIP domain-containing serine protease B8-like isoform X2 n=1 Tax=Battus philenor TaxID=42288 RepID=UPI0035CF2F41